MGIRNELLCPRAGAIWQGSGVHLWPIGVACGSGERRQESRGSGCGSRRPMVRAALPVAGDW